MKECSVLTEKPIFRQITGNPFVDAGVSAIQLWLQKSSPEEITKDDLREMIEQIAPVYCSKGWKKTLYSVFPNNTVTNPANSKKDIQSLLTSKLNEYLEAIETLGNSGNCMGCGGRDAVFSLTKTEVPLTGSGSLRNFFPLFDSGVGYCAACTLAIQFSPIVFYACGKLLMLHSNSPKVLKSWAKKCIKDVRKQIILQSLTGCPNENYVNPQNAFFHIVEGLIRDYDERWYEEDVAIRLYHFTNYNQRPELDIYDFPSDVFHFLSYVKTSERFSDWKKLVKKGYIKVNWEKVKEEDEYKNKKNIVYQRLLNGQTIVRFFIDYQERQVIGDWSLFSLYLKEVRKMSEDRLDCLQRVGDEIAQYIQESNELKRLTQMEMARTYAEFRNVLRWIIKGRIAIERESPLFSLQEYLEHLFPTSPSGITEWRETRDLLLFRIYETLHDWLKSQKSSDEIQEEINNEEQVVLEEEE